MPVAPSPKLVTGRQPSMENHYRTLGLSSSATADEIRRAYRILARRYHPDLNPGGKTEDKFKKIADAYHVLSDPERKRQFDIELEATERLSGRSHSTSSARLRREAGIRREFEKRKFQEFGKGAPEPEPPPRSNPQPQAARTSANKSRSERGALGGFLRRGYTWWKQAGAKQALTPPSSRGPLRISIIEVSVTVRDAIFGMKKTVEIEEPNGNRKISVSIPAGVRNGSVVRLRARNNPQEEIVLIVRVANHPFISIQAKGVVIEIPVTVQEALLGASITVPTFEEPMTLRIAPASQSGTELRAKERGVRYRDGSRGDLFYRLMIRAPDAPEAVGLREKVQALEAYYGTAVRSTLPASLVTE